MRIISSSRQRTATPLLLAVMAASCGDDGGIPDDMFGDTDTTTGDPTSGSTGMNGTGDTEPDGADETGGGGPTAVEGRCLYDPETDLYGYRYQCGGSLWLDVTIEHGFAGSPEHEPIPLEFGSGVHGDSYASPYVLACCPWYDPETSQCSQPHERACWVDLVEQGCKSMVGRIESFAHERFPGWLQTAQRNAVLKVADHVRDHQGQCTAAFRVDTGIAETQPTCDENGNSVPYTSMLEDGVWTFDPDGPVDKVEIAVAEAVWGGLYPVAEPLATAICISGDDNDGVLFLEVDPVPGSKVLHLAAGSIELVGPDAAGIGELSTTSTLVLANEGPTASLEDLALHAAGMAAVHVNEATIPVDDFHVRLWERAAAVAEGSTWTVPPAGAHFAVSATALGETRVQTATNATAIVITKDVQGWHSSAFFIEVSRRDGYWSLVVGPGRWQ